MPSSKITVPNPVGKDEALKRIKGLTSGGENLDVQENWTDDGGTFSGEIYGLDVSGSIELRETDVEIDLTYPMAARPFESKVESTLQERTENCSRRKAPC